MSSRRATVRRIAFVAFSALTAGVLVGSWPGDAHADDIDQEERFRSLAVQGNPLGLAIGRYSADLEYLPEPHHALHVTPFGYYALPGVSDQLTGFGGEVGYRWYSGIHGPQGFFAGVSFIAGDMEYAHTTSHPSALDTPSDTVFIELGGAIDGGFQLVMLGNFAIGIGAGAEYVVDTIRPRFEFVNHPWHDFFYGWGLRPRVLLSVGAAF
jgi:hypothetical protein